MTETPTEETVEETPSEEFKPFTDEQDREIAYRSDANPAAASGSQVRPNPALMSVQSAIMRLLPSRLVAPAGMTKAGMLAVLGAVAKADFREELSEIDVPTLVLCGMQDRPNLPAARLLASGIANAELQLVPGAGHEWNTEHPREFSARLNTFYSRFRAA